MKDEFGYVYGEDFTGEPVRMLKEKEVRLYGRDELDLTPGPSPKGRGEKWDPTQDKRLTA